MTQLAERTVTDRAPAAMIAGAIPLIDVSGHLAGDSEASREAVRNGRVGRRPFVRDFRYLNRVQFGNHSLMSSGPSELWGRQPA